MTGPLYGRPYTGDEMDLAHQGYHADATRRRAERGVTEVPTQPVFTARPTVTGEEVDGIVVMVNGHDLVAVFPTVPPLAPGETPWQLGYWDADSGEWVDADPEGDFSAQLVKYLALGDGTLTDHGGQR